MIRLILFEKKIRNNRRLTVREIASDVGISMSNSRSISSDNLGMKNMSEK